MKKEILLMGLMFLLPSLAFASHDTMFWIQGELFSSSTMLPAPNVQMSVDIFTTATCSGSPYWTGTFPSATDVNGVYSLMISNISMNFNQEYYACVYANATLVNGAIPFRAGQGQINEFDVDFTDLNITDDLFVGDKLTVIGDIDPQNIYLSGNIYMDFMREVNWGSGYTLIYNNVTNQFEFNDRVNIDGDLNVDGNVTAFNFFGDGSGLTNVTGTVAYKGLYYVSENGSDSTGDGTIGNPYKTYQAVLDNSSEQMVYITILSPDYIADQNLTIPNYRGVSIMNTVGLAPYHAGEINSLVAGIDSSFVGWNINIKDSITCGASGWSDIYMDGGGLVNDITFTNKATCVFWFAGTQIKPEDWNELQTGTAGLSGYAQVRDKFAIPDGINIYGDDRIDFNWNNDVLPKTLRYNTTSARFEFNDNVYAPHFIGDGSGITNITADDLDIDDDEWLYLDTADTRGIRWNSSGNNIELNQRLYVPNMISANSVTAQNGYYNYLALGYTGASPSNPFTIMNSTGTQKLSIDFTGDIAFLDDSEDNYITWNESGIGVWDYGTYHALEMWAGWDVEDTILMYNNINVTGNVTADYFIGDGSQLTNLPVSAQYWNRTGTILYPATAGDDVNVSGGDIYLGDNDVIIFDNAQNNGMYYDSTNGVLQISTDNGTFFDDTIRLNQNSPIDWQGKTLMYNSAILSFIFNDDLKVSGDVNVDGNVYPVFTETYNIGNDTYRWLNINSKNAFIGNSTGNTTITPTGLTLSGTARVYKEVQQYAYNIYGLAGTRNGITCGASALSSLTSRWIMMAFDDGGGVGTCESSVSTMRMPSDYVAGTNFNISVTWTASATSGDVVFGIGIAPASDGDSYSTATDTWQTGTTTKGATSYGRQTVNVQFSGTGIQKDDDIVIIFYRDADNGADTMTGDALVSDYKLIYLSDRIGS
jgi:hypothetical protein